ncbi:hypothetical protein BD311DRAFT_751834 [Dichomitus squalens]|uniref:Uncharacterized protein n=1 Tax=Dichomitus squalens TaxID=114155 RepID=A0A4Q9MV97_9APHY|nr:hypothetical protein BD311DRAFT_751834 [Dichomitus squalens]
MFILPSNKPWRHRFTAPVYCRRRCHESCRHPEREPALSLRHRQSQPHVSRTTHVQIANCEWRQTRPGEDADVGRIAAG